MDENAVAEPLLRAWLSGENMTRAKAMQIPYVAGAINEIAKTVANIPIRLYQKEGKKVIEIADDPRVFLLNEETGDTLDANQMKQAVVRVITLAGADIYMSTGRARCGIPPLRF